MKRVTFSIVTITCYTFFSCAPYRYIYTASPSNDPFFKEKGDSKVAAYYSAGGGDPTTNKYSRGFDVHGAYALSNHWAVTASYLNRREKDDYNYGMYGSSDVHYRRNIIDAGIGYFVFLNHAKSISANIYTGIGKGKFIINNTELMDTLAYSEFHRSSITRWYIMPAFNFFPGNFFRCSFTTKFSFVHYGNIQTNYTDDELSYYGLDRIANKTLYFFEPALNFQFVNPVANWLAVNLSFSFSSDYQYHDPYYETLLTVRKFNGSIGVNVDLSKLISKNKK